MTEIKELIRLSKDFSVLYVEDEKKLRESVVKYLEKFFKSVDYAVDGLDGLRLYKQNKYDVIITDIIMPNLNGVKMAQEMKKINSKQEIVIVSASSELDYFIESIKIGVDGYVLKPINFDQMNEVLYKVVFKISEIKQNELYKNNLQKLVDEKTKETKILEKEKVENYKKTLYALVEMIEQRDTYTGGHSARVAIYSKQIAKHMGFDETFCNEIYEAGILHDIGKVAIPDSILLKPKSLSDLEYKLIKDHVIIGYNIIIKMPIFEKVAITIKSHHERYDGSGYPQGLRGEEIPFSARIMAVADSFDAMTTNRIYKRVKSVDEALSELKKLSGITLCKKSVNAAIVVLKDTKINADINQNPISKIEEARFSYFYKDQLTGIYNSEYLDLMLIKNFYNNHFAKISILCIDGFGKYNKRYGWDDGDKVLIKVAEELMSLCADGVAFRVHGDDFIVLSNDSINFFSIINNFPNLKFSQYELSLPEENINSIRDLDIYIDNNDALI